ncbi:hypothetical protein SCLARK_00922 [Spiroplasma clarkii]|uniref:hypothetical protein n=1 Tax=Spiroplasma clarkii TaxID=2139 RepID=UPI000B57D542|nr:hypothetical protein [Spiroplasma clarkii]ARU91530.1 hypothetical protein SCLARK_00922 [Spiroplasma clarkii]
MKTYKLFVDGGGTSTKVYLTDPQHNILETKVFAGMNIQQGVNKILQTVQEIKDYFTNNFEEIYLGMPGVHEFQAKPEIIKIFASVCQNTQIVTDIEVQEHLFITEASYYMLCLGSGTIMIEKDQQHKKFLNGFGPMFQDDGSAFKFAQNFIAKALVDWQIIFQVTMSIMFMIFLKPMIWKKLS